MEMTVTRPDGTVAHTKDFETFTINGAAVTEGEWWVFVGH